MASNRRLILGAMVLSGAGLMLMTTGSVWVSLGFRFAHDFGDGATGTLLALYISRLFERISVGGSAALVLAVQILAKMLGAIVLSPLGFRYGLQWPFLIAGALLLLDAAYGAVIFRRIEY
jgi:MFS family permease